MKIELTQGQVTLIDDVDYEYLSQWKWRANWHRKRFRAMRNSDENKAIYIHTVIAERMGIDHRRIDHIDHNSLNNQRSNLRFATGSQNSHNRGPQSNNTTGVKGVWFHKQRGRYVAEITVEGQKYYLGLFDTVPEAEKIVIAKREELVGEFACN